MSGPSPAPPEAGARGELAFVARESSWAGILGLAGAGLRYLNTLILTRLLGTAAYGIFALANTIVAVLAMPASLGLQTATVHFVAAGAGRREWGRLRWVIRASVGLVLVSGLFWGALVFFSAPWSSTTLFRKPELALPLAGLAFSLPFLGLANVFGGSLQGMRQIRAKVILDRIAHPLVFSLLLLAAGLISRTLELAAAAFVAASLVVALWGAVRLVRGLGTIPAPAAPAPAFWKDLLVFSTPVMALNLLNFLVLWSDVLVMGIYRPAAEVGIYQVASRLALAVNMPLEALNSSLAPNFSAMHSRRDAAGLRTVYQTSTRWIFLLSSLVFLVLVFGGRPVLWVFGRDFQEGYLALTLLAAGQLISSSMGANGTLITQTGYPAINLANVLFLGLLNLGLMFWLVPLFGATGAAAAAAVSLAVVNLARTLEIRLLFKISPWDRTFSKPLAVFALAAGAGGAAWWLAGEWAGLVAGPPVFLLAWWLAGPEPADRDLLRRGIYFFSSFLSSRKQSSGV